MFAVRSIDLYCHGGDFFGQCRFSERTRVEMRTLNAFIVILHIELALMFIYRKYKCIHEVKCVRFMTMKGYHDTAKAV